MGFSQSRPSRLREGLRPRHDGEEFTRTVPALVLALAGGLIAPFAFDPYGVGGLLPVSLTLLIAGSFTRRASIAALAGLVWGTAAFLALFAWANIYAGLDAWIALAVFEALFIAVFSLCARLMLVRFGIGSTAYLGIALAWAAVEYARSSLPWGGLPWASSAFAYAASPLLNYGPWVSIVGLGVLTGLLGALGFGMVSSLLFRRKRWHNGLAAVWPAAGIMGIILASLVIPRPDLAVDSNRSSLTVAGIQGNVTPPPPGSYYLPTEMFANHVRQTERYLDSGGRASLIVWPEDSTGWDVVGDAARMGVLSRLSQRAGAPLLVGSQVPAHNDKRYNKALLVNDNGLTDQEYTKRHPVPFGEYVPARDVFSAITKKTELVGRDMLPGNEVGVINVDGVRTGVLICFEIAYEDSVRTTVKDGAEVLIVQSNNALFGDSHEAVQQRAQARVFAVISGRSIVHLSTVGPSVIVTPDGRELATLDHWTSGTLEATVPLTTGLTPAMKYADAYLALVVGGSVIALLLALMTPARTRKENR